MAMELVWLGQGGFLIRCGGASICLDPYLSDSCERSGGIFGLPRVASGCGNRKNIAERLDVNMALI